jgi:RimJ/RimL family protein N-acetyltransferase
MVIKGKKVILRKAKLSDAERFVKWVNDDEVNRFMSVRKIGLKEERKYIQDRIDGKTKNNFHFCIETKEGLHIGATGLEKINKRNKSATFGIVIGDKNYWSKGYGTESAKLILDFGFKKLKLHRIQLDVYSYNPRAIKLYKKLGFKKEGIKREHNFYKGKFYDTILMSVLSREWKLK